MKAKLTFYPLGNADCCLVEFADGRVLVNDYAASRGDVEDDPRIDLPKALREDLEDRDHVDVLAISHLDEDHYRGVSDLFHLDHSTKYQSGDRLRIDELWVPAAVIVEKAPDAEEAKAIQAEARYRLKHGEGIRVFSRPDCLEEWLLSQRLKLSDRAHLITYAGCLVPTFSLGTSGAEIFVHSPFAESVEDGSSVVRNSGSLAFQVTFEVGATSRKVLFGADLDHEDLRGIVAVTCAHNNESRLQYDVAKLPHHCSYLSLASDKGNPKTTPLPEIRWLYEEQGAHGAILVSSSSPIAGAISNDPPHPEAAKYYEGVAADLLGEFVVTMEHPKVSAPERLVIEFGSDGASRRKRVVVGSPLVSRPAPRAG